mmetsp:Transcript_76759/g.159695  ORF Transcript_76759/g.159695 Transcript_76759/m.159695 type:complete len:367 (+) Transcript_76759:938-2038(+)
MRHHASSSLLRKAMGGMPGHCEVDGIKEISTEAAFHNHDNGLIIIEVFIQLYDVGVLERHVRLNLASVPQQVGEIPGVQPTLANNLRCQSGWVAALLPHTAPDGAEAACPNRLFAKDVVLGIESLACDIFICISLVLGWSYTHGTLLPNQRKAQLTHASPIVVSRRPLRLHGQCLCFQSSALGGPHPRSGGLGQAIDDGVSVNIKGLGYQDGRLSKRCQAQLSVGSFLPLDVCCLVVTHDELVLDGVFTLHSQRIFVLPGGETCLASGQDKTLSWVPISQFKAAANHPDVHSWLCPVARHREVAPCVSRILRHAERTSPNRCGGALSTPRRATGHLTAGSSNCAGARRAFRCVCVVQSESRRVSGQ